jgi:hypothetical protein
MRRLEVIQKIINKVGCKTYLEIGVEYGSVFLNVDAPRKIGVDPDLRISLSNKITHLRDIFKNNYYQKKSDDFFAADSHIFEDNKIDVAFIDGLHTYRQSFSDLKNCLKYLNDGGVIVMHDCNPESPAMAAPSIEEYKRYPIPGKAWCGDVWKTIARIRSDPDYGNLDAFVLDCNYGLGVITRSKQKNRLSYTVSDIEKMSYKDLEDNRDKILNLKDPNYLNEFIYGTTSEKTFLHN